MLLSLLAFAGAAFLIVLLPGPDTLMVLKTSLTDGRKAGTYVAAGPATGNVVWGVASVVGVATLLAASATAFSVVKLAGALYLAYLGYQALRAAYRGDTVTTARDTETKAPFRKGLLCDLLNVKVGLFWTALVPQFLLPGAGPAPAAAMVLTMALLAVAGMTGFAFLAGRLRPLLARRGVSQLVNVAVGGLLVALAAGMAFAH